MCMTVKYLYNRFKGSLNILKESAIVNNKHKLLHKVVEEKYLNPDEIIYLDIISRKKPSYRGSNNWILI